MCWFSIKSFAQTNIYTSYKSIITSSLLEKEKVIQVELLLVKNNSKNNQDFIQLYFDFSKWNWQKNNDELRAIKYAKKVDEILSKSKTNKLLFKRNLFNLGIFNYKKNHPNYANALYYLDRLITISNKFEQRIGVTFRVKGDIYGDLGDFQKAIENYENAEIILENLDLKKKLRQVYIGVSATYAELNDSIYKKPFLENQKKIKALEKETEFTENDKIKLKLNEGNIYYISTKYNRALRSYEEGLKMAKEEKDSVRIFDFFNGIGVIYRMKKEYNKATDFYNQSKKYMLDDPYAISINYNNIAGLYLAKNDFENALLNYNKAIESLLPFENINLSKQLPSVEIIKISLYKKDILDYLIEKANALVIYYNDTSDTSKLFEAEKILALADKIIDLLFLDSSENLSKLFWRKKAADLYFNAISICFLLKKPNRAMYYMEKNKGLLLIENINAYKAKQLAKIPVIVTEKENEYLASINKIRNDLMNTSYSKKQIDSIKIKLLSKKHLFKIFIDSLDIEYPKYFNLKKQLDIISVVGIQKKITDSTFVFEYIIGNNFGYVILLTKDDVEFKKLENVKELMKTITLFKKQIAKPFINHNDKKEFQKISNKLYLTLFPFNNFTKKISNKKVIVVADNELQYIPFEALSTSINSNLESSYLVQYCDINYKYSLSLEMQFNLKEERKTNSFVSFVPLKFNHSGLASLNGNLRDEVANSLLFKNNVFRKEKATKATFLKAYNEHDILHVSTHGGVENDVPWLAFYDKKLYLDELYFLKNQKELVVLSACKTADGKLLKGEGLYNLTRGFINSGAKSVLSTLWDVNEKSNAEVINEFYKNIKNHKSKSTSLTIAKRNYLSKYKNTSQASPYYWSAIILTGNGDAILIDTISWKYIITSLVIIVMLFAYMKQKRIIRKKSKL